MIRLTTAVLTLLLAAVPGAAPAITYGQATCGQLVDEVVKTKTLFDAAAEDIKRRGEQPVTGQEIVQLSLLTQRHDRAFAILAVKCPETLANIEID